MELVSRLITGTLLTGALILGCGSPTGFREAPIENKVDTIPGNTVYLPPDTIPGETVHLPADTVQLPTVYLPADTVQLPATGRVRGRVMWNLDGEEYGSSRALVTLGDASYNITGESLREDEHINGGGLRCGPVRPRYGTPNTCVIANGSGGFDFSYVPVGEYELYILNFEDPDVVLGGDGKRAFGTSMTISVTEGERLELGNIEIGEVNVIRAPANLDLNNPIFDFLRNPFYSISGND